MGDQSKCQDDIAKLKVRKEQLTGMGDEAEVKIARLYNSIRTQTAMQVQAQSMLDNIARE